MITHQEFLVGLQTEYSRGNSWCVLCLCSNIWRFQKVVVEICILGCLVHCCHRYGFDVLIMNYFKNISDVFTHFTTGIIVSHNMFIWQISCVLHDSVGTYDICIHAVRATYLFWFLSSAPAGCCAFLNKVHQKQTGGQSVDVRSVLSQPFSFVQREGDE